MHDFMSLFLMQRASSKASWLTDLTAHHGLIRDKLDGRTYIYRDYLPGKPPMREVHNPYENYTAIDGPHLSLAKVPRRFDFLHPIVQSGALSSKQYSTVLPLERYVNALHACLNSC